MEFEKKKTQENGKQERTFKKKLALAAVTASLGLSLGVPVGDALAGDDNDRAFGGGTLGISTEDFKTVLESKQGKFKTGVESRQGKFKTGIESKQGKLNTGIESRQGKFKPGQGALDSLESSQIKIDRQLDDELDAESLNMEE